MIDLINYVTLSFDSYNIIKNKEKLISFIDELNYEKYHRLITEKILNNINENVKILFSLVDMIFVHMGKLYCSLIFKCMLTKDS